MNHRDPATRRKEVVCFLLLALITIALFSQLFNRETALSYSIGYNLYGAERVVDGEVPYRDFHTLYPPATVYLNAAIFKYFGITLYNALFGVMIFKVLTTLAIYGCARRVMPASWALVAASFSLIWLRPNGPFKAVPMHYGALFLSLALFFLLDKKNNRLSLILAGIALGVLALFKHNIGAYALAGTLATFLIDEKETKLSFKYLTGNIRAIVTLLAGFLLPVIPTLLFIQAKGVFNQMVSTLLFGPGEFLLNRLAGAPQPFVPLLFALVIFAVAVSVNRLKDAKSVVLAIIGLGTLTLVLFGIFAPQRFIDALIFYLPIFLILAALYFVLFARRVQLANQRQLALIALFSAAALMEAFPRFAREQAIAAMPFVGLLLIYLLYCFKSKLHEFFENHLSFKLALAALPLLLFLMGARLFAQTFFDSSLHLRSNTELAIDRGRKVYFPRERANEIVTTTDYIREQVPEGGYFFAESYAGSSFLFLTDRNNPSGAQFWGGVGVKETERLATLEALKREKVKLIVASQRDLEAEKFTPMREFIEQNFKLTRQIGEVQILERDR
jgi:hypothetical protein